MSSLPYFESSPLIVTLCPKAEAVPARKRVVASRRKTARRQDLTRGSPETKDMGEKKAPTVARRRASACASGLALLGPYDSELLHLPVQRGPLHSEAGGCTLRPAQHPAGFIECCENVLALGVGQRNRQR